MRQNIALLLWNSRVTEALVLTDRCRITLECMIGSSISTHACTEAKVASSFYQSLYCPARFAYARYVGKNNNACTVTWYLCKFRPALCSVCCLKRQYSLMHVQCCLTTKSCIKEINTQSYTPFFTSFHATCQVNSIFRMFCVH